MPSINIENGKRIEDLLEISHFTNSAHFLVSEHNLTRKTTLLNLRYMFNGDIAIDNLNNLYYSVEKINEIIDRIDDDFSKITKRIDVINAKLEQIYNDLGDDLDEFRKRIENIYNELKQADQDLYTYITKVINQEANTRKDADDQLKILIDKERSERIQNDTVLESKIKEISDTIMPRIEKVEQGLEKEIKDRQDADANLQGQITNISNVVTYHGKAISALESKMAIAESNIINNWNNLNSRVYALENKITISNMAPGSLENGKIWLQYF